METNKISILSFGLIFSFDTYYAFNFTYNSLNQEIFSILPCLIYMLEFIYELKFIIGLW